MKPDISIVIATYNRGDYLPATIRQALAQEGCAVEVIVVDQTPAYAPEVQAALQPLLPRVTYLKQAAPNASTARNAGVAAARADIILFVDDDTEFGPGLAAGHLEAHRAPGVGCVTGLIVADAWENRERCAEHMRRSHRAEFPAVRDRVWRIAWAASGNTSYKRAAFEAVGGFDEYLNRFCEDADLSVRVRAAGWELHYAEALELLHLSAPSGGCEQRAAGADLSVQRDLARCSLYYLIKNRRHAPGPFGVWPLVWASLRTTALNRPLVATRPWLVPGRLWAWLAALGDACRYLAATRRKSESP